MVIIQDLSDTKFSFNGVPYFKNFTPVVRGDKTMIVNTYDSKIRLNELEDFSEYQVNGSAFANVGDLQNALLPVVFVRLSLGGASGGSLDFNDLGDVNITNLTDGDGIYFDSTVNRWVNAPNQNTVPVENRYDTNALMTADYINQSIGLFQFVEDARTAAEINNGIEPYSAYYEYLGETNNDITDYSKLSDTEVQLITNTQFNNFTVKAVTSSSITETSIYSGISFTFNPVNLNINGVVFNPTFSKYLLDYIGNVNDLNMRIWNNSAEARKLLFANIKEIYFTDSTEVFVGATLEEEIDYQSINILDNVVIDFSRSINESVTHIDFYENIPLEVGVYTVKARESGIIYFNLPTNIYNYDDNIAVNFSNSNIRVGDFLSVKRELTKTLLSSNTPFFIDSIYDMDGYFIGTIRPEDSEPKVSVKVDYFNDIKRPNKYILSEESRLSGSFFGYIELQLTEENFTNGTLTLPYSFSDSLKIYSSTVFLGNKKISNFEIGLESSYLTENRLVIVDYSSSFENAMSDLDVSILIEYDYSESKNKRIAPFSNNTQVNVVNLEISGDSHSNKMDIWFNESYGVFTGYSFHGASETLPFYSESEIHIRKNDYNVDLFYSAGTGRVLISNAFFKNNYSIVPVGSNTLEEINHTDAIDKFPPNYIIVTSRAETDNDGTDPLGTSYGFGTEFNEPARGVDLAAAGYTDYGGQYHQQSPATAIVAGKLKYIKDQSGATWDIVRQAARQTASNANTYNIYRGFGQIDTAAAIALIPTLEAAKSLELAEYYEQTTVMPLVLKYEDKALNTFVNKRDLKEVESCISGSIFDEAIDPTAPLVVKFSEVLSESNGLFYDELTGRFIAQHDGYLDYSFTGLSTGGAARLVVGYNNMTPSMSNNKGQSYAPGSFNTLAINKRIFVNANDYIVFYLVQGTLRNRLNEHFGDFKVKLKRT